MKTYLISLALALCLAHLALSFLSLRSRSSSQIIASSYLSAGILAILVGVVLLDIASGSRLDTVWLGRSLLASSMGIHAILGYFGIRNPSALRAEPRLLVVASALALLFVFLAAYRYPV